MNNGDILHMKTYLAITVFTFFIALYGCGKQVAVSVDDHGFSAPTKLTADLNAAVEKELPLDDQQDFEEARRGFIASDGNLKVVNPDIGTIWDQTAYTFMEGKAPPSANPGLWRQARLNNIHGLFEVTKGIYQLRGFDLANMTLIQGKNGWIVVDPLTAKETSARAWAFAMQHLPPKPITAVIFTHSHIDLFGEAEIHFGVHNWPIWGNDRVVDFLKKQRDVYTYIHDQTVRMANAGLTPREISAELEFPESMRTTFSNRGYYGTLSHNAKAVYQFYFGWYDANPANLNPLPPVDSGKRYVQFMGGAESVLAKAQASFDKGEYRWTAEVLNHLVFAEPENDKARELLSRTYDQLGYQAESGPWRDVYLTGAYELRHGGPEKGLDISNAMELLEQTPISKLLTSMAVRLNGPKADGKNLMINLVFTDLNQSYVLHLENAVLHHKMAPPDPEANATLNITHQMFLNMAMNTAGIKEFVFSDDVKIEGSKIDLIRFFTLLDRPKGRFNIVTP